MFPLPFNIPFRKKDGTLSTLGDELNNGGGGSSYTLPTASANVKGGVKIGEGLTMDGEVLKNTNPTPATPYTLPTASADVKGGIKIGSGLTMDGEVLNVTGGGTSSEGIYEPFLKGRPIFKHSSTPNKYYAYGVTSPITTNNTTVTAYFESVNLAEYNINDVYNPPAFNNYEYYNYITSDLISDLNATELFTSLDSATASVTLSDSLANYSAIILQGCYNSSGEATYDTTMIYTEPTLNTDYWFGVKDRNSSYSSMVNFTDNTHATIKSAKRIKIYGIPKNV